MRDILLVEDHEELNTLIRTFLEKAQYSVKSVFSGEEALEFWNKERAKLVILDVSLPEMDGFSICRTIREYSSVPILFLSARVGKEDKMNGYLLGADDYMEKPVDMDILLAKVDALMYRNYELREKKELLCSGKIVLDRAAKKVTLSGKEIVLNGKEFELLQVFLENPGKVLRKDFLFRKIWGIDSFSEEQTLTVHIKMLRDKIEEEPRNPKRIQTVWGVGYRYEEV